MEKSAGKEVQKLDPQVIPRLINETDKLSDSPRPEGCRKLTGSKNLYRVRVGDYRIIYSVIDENSTVIIQYARHRKDAYDF